MLSDGALPVEIDFVPGNGRVQGSVLDPAGSTIDFSGWMELVAALHSLTGATRRASTDLRHGQPDPA
jgi:hypothetical protein